MPERKNRNVRAGFGQDHASLTVEDVQFEDQERNLNYKVEEIASYTLRYFPDSDEVALIKGDEILYSELLS